MEASLGYRRACWEEKGGRRGWREREEKEEKGEGEGASDSKDGCFTLKTWKVKTTVGQRLYTATFQQVQACAVGLVGRRSGKPSKDASKEAVSEAHPV